MKCPNCGAEIDNVILTETRTFRAEVDLKDGTFNNGEVDVDSYDFLCPNCEQQIPTDEAEGPIKSLREKLYGRWEQ